MSGIIEVFRRPNLWIDRLRSYRVVIDGQSRGGLKRGQTILIEVPAGIHDLYLQIDWARSQQLELRIAEGETLRLECWNAANAWTVLYMATRARKRYIGVQQLDRG